MLKSFRAFHVWVREVMPGPEIVVQNLISKSWLVHWHSHAPVRRLRFWVRCPPPRSLRLTMVSSTAMIKTFDGEASREEMNIYIINNCTRIVVCHAGH